MHLNLEAVKKHPYAVGGAVLVGGLVLFLLLSSSQGSAASQPATSSGTASAGQLLSADLQMQQIQAGVAVQSQQAQVQLATAQLTADTQNKQTAAALEAQKSSDMSNLGASIVNTQAQVQIAGIQAASDTTQQANQLQYAQNMQQMQDSVLDDNITASVAENANNNATLLGNTQITANYQLGVAQLQHDSNTVNDLTTLAQTQIAAGVVNNTTNDAYKIEQSKQDAVNSQLGYIVQHAGDKKNSALDAVDQTSLFNTVLSGFNPSVAATGTSASASAANSGNAATASIVSSIGQTVASLGNSVSRGLFA